jgi:hypothetical protein
MTGPELDVASIRTRLGLSVDGLAAELNVTPAVIEAWESGRASLTPYVASWLRWKDAVADREAAFVAAGLAPCRGLGALASSSLGRGLRGATRRTIAIREHLATCPTCLARQKYADEQLPPMPPTPLRGWQRVALAITKAVQRLPSWARPAALSGGLLFALVMLRGLFLIPSAMSHPELLIGLAKAAGIATAAGVIGGLTYSAVREPLRRFGRAGDYLTGVACVLAYMGALAIGAPVLLGEPIVKQLSDLWIFGIASVVFGLLIGHFWFRPRRSSSTPTTTA